MEHMMLEGPPTATTFDEASLERSKGFVKALQELKNLRPQLYSAAEYCEKSFIHSEQKQMVLDNLKDYTVRALVNAVDHLGTVAYKLTDILEQQTSDVGSTELKLTCLSQQLLTCQAYMGKEGLRQQQLLAIIPKHHKHYILPGSVNKKVHFSPTVHPDLRQVHVQTRPRVHPADSAGAQTLSWHLSTETKPTRKGNPKSSSSSEAPKGYLKSAGVFRLLDNEESARTRSATPQPQSSNRGNTGSGVTYKDASSVGLRPMTPFRRTPTQIIKAPPRTKNMISAFFVKHKSQRLKTRTAA